MNSSNGPVLGQETAASAGKPTKKAVERERVRILIDSAKQVGPALFFLSLLLWFRSCRCSCWKHRKGECSARWRGRKLWL